MLALESSRSATTTSLTTDFGGHSDRVTPVPIPNTEVKPVSADGTWGENPWESRTPPDFDRTSAPGLPGALVRVEVIGKLRRAFGAEPKIGDLLP